MSTATSRYLASEGQELRGVMSALQGAQKRADYEAVALYAERLTLCVTGINATIDDWLSLNKRDLDGKSLAAGEGNEPTDFHPIGFTDSCH